ncbi:MAG: hypothetical protein CML28_03160 [Rhizobiales bacterium]|nr:hypothetical protein [Hyphomicrobiales bacterium]
MKAEKYGLWVFSEKRDERASIQFVCIVFIFTSDYIICMNDVKPETTITHILISAMVGILVMCFAIDFSQTENLNRLMDSFFWLAFIVTFFTLRYRKPITAWMRKKFQ